jgi:hypothetical protein
VEEGKGHLLPGGQLLEHVLECVDCYPISSVSGVHLDGLGDKEINLSTPLGEPRYNALSPTELQWSSARYQNEQLNERSELRKQ